jgi:hypothetical protein
MARLFQAGAEINAGAGTVAQNAGPDGTITGTVTRDTSVFNAGGGVASWKCDSTASNLAANVAIASSAFVDGVTYYFRAYMNCASLTGNQFGTTIIRLGALAGSGPSILFYGAAATHPGALAVNIAGTGLAAFSPSVADGNWHLVELQGVATATGNWTFAQLRVDGTVIDSVTHTQAYSGTGAIFGWTVTPTASQVINFDDVVLNDSTGAANNTYPGAGAVVLLKPTADSAVGTGWVTGAGGSTSLFDAVNGTPPEGVADTGTATSQIRNATSNATSYDATMTTYSAAGVSAGATVNAVLPVTATAAPVTTSAKQGTVGVVSNPTITNVALNATGTAGAFWAGLAAGTYGAGWKWSLGTMTEAPTVTLGTAPVMRITNSTASTRIADVCFMGIYVDYTPAVVAAATTVPVHLPFMR